MTLALDFTLRQGSFLLSLRDHIPMRGLTAIFGPSGAGKSSLLRAIAGFVPTAGLIRFGDEIWENGRVFVPPYRRRIGFVFQEPQLFSHLSVAGNLAYAARRAGTMDEVPAIVARFDLAALLDRQPGRLSGGEAQRVALARALLCKPRLLLMDEPLSALDAARRGEILPHIERLRDDGLPILYVSHSLPEVARLAGRVLALADGKCVGHGPTAAVLNDAGAAPAFGGEEPGSLIEARLDGQDPDGLSLLSFAGGRLLVPGLNAAPGSVLRLLVATRDVMIALTRPEGVSALNILAVTVVALEPAAAGSVRVRLACQGGDLSARITARSAAALNLTPGLECFAILKSVALARD